VFRLTLVAGAIIGAFLSSASQEPVATGLAALWTTDGALRDSNSDGFADSTRLAIVLQDPTDAAQIAAAANLAGRLGFETMSLDLPLVPAADGPRILVGTPMALTGEMGAATEPRGYVFVDEEPSSLHVWGDDDASLTAAAVWLAGRAPLLWDKDSASLNDLESLLQEWATSVAVEITSAVPIGVILEPGAPGVDVVVDVVLAESSAPDQLLDLEAQPVIEGARVIYLRHVGSAGPALEIHSAGAAVEVGGSPPGSGREEFDLAAIYTKSGLFGDSNGDEIPDRLEALVSGFHVAPEPLMGLAARLGLEATGIRIPAVVVPEAVEDGPGGTRVLLGASHPAIEKLIEDGKLTALDPASGPGATIEVVREAFGDHAAIVVRGSGGQVDSAVRYLGETAPYLSRRGKDAPELLTISTDMRRFLARRTAAGQAAAGVDIARAMVSSLPDDALDAAVTLTVDRVDSGLDAHLRLALGDAVASVRTQSRDVRAAPEIWRLETELESEPDQLRRVVLARLAAADQGAAAVDVAARISEPLAVRERLESELEGALLKSGARSARVQILPAYKQGFGWLEEDVLPRIRQSDIDHIRIEYARNDPPASWPYQAMQTPTRWLLEIFPIDEILSRELGLPLSAIEFVEKTTEGSIYRVVATSKGDVVLDEEFSPALVERPYFDIYPAYERVRVAAGWVRVASDGVVVADEHLPTDLERVWDIYQTQVIPTLHDYTMRLHEGAPRAAYAPHFGELLATIKLSEPDRELGVDKERIAPMEALHEELYFGTLHFFDLLGRISSGSVLGYPGRVIPIVEPMFDGSPGQVLFTLSGFESPVPRVELVYQLDGVERRVRRDLPPLDVTVPTVRSVRVESALAVAGVDLWLPVDAHVEAREDLLQSYSARQLDTAWVTSERLAGALHELEQLRQAGLYVDELAYETTPGIEVVFGDAFTPGETDHNVLLAAAQFAVPAPDPAALIAAQGATHRVQWETPMPPDEAHSVIAVMAQEFDEATVYRLGTSYLDKEIWGLDLMAPLPGSHWSQAKASAYKPTVVYSARQHANEVSSTSHVLRLAETVLDDPEWQQALKRVNVVVHPITNPDGAQLAYELHQLTPDHMLHAGYLGALGVDVTSATGDTDPIYPESNVRERLWQTWLPDIFLNPHGYPSHEWVQPFSEYAGWVRHRTTQSRDWWGMRGWFMPGFSYLDDPDYPRHMEHAFLIRDAITSAINAVPGIAALNERAYARYRRYGHDADPETFRLNFADGVLIYTSLKGTRAGDRGWMGRNPKVTIWSGSTEAPDETAYGEWLELVASGGLAWDQAILRYLLELEHPVERSVASFDGAAALELTRERPGRLPGEEE